MTRSFKTHKIRKQTELGGLWSFTPLDYDMGMPQPMHVRVPSCWESYPGYQNYRGRARYETVLEGGGNIRIVCKGVSHTATVKLNGREIASHYGAYTAFGGHATGLPQGTHSLCIEVDNRFSEDSALHVPNDYMTYGGVVRPVLVEELPAMYIEWLHAVPVHTANGWVLQTEAKIVNLDTEPHTADLRVTLAGQVYAMPALNIPPSSSGTVSTELCCTGVETYEQENPVLYLLESRLHIDQHEQPADDLIERVGFREVKVRGKDILLNGKPIRFKGLCRHEDHPQFGCAMPLAALEYDLNQIADLGANAVRAVHYPSDELFLDLCDERGLLVWQENHARALEEPQMRNPNFRRQAMRCTEEMVVQRFNHPSIIIWGILNECGSETEYGKMCYAEQLARIKELDASRPTSFASCKFFTDICFGLPDIVSYNLYPEWYHETPAAEYLDQIYSWVQDETEGRGKPFIISEIGAGGLFGYRGGNESKWSEEKQAEILAHQVGAVLDAPYVNGIFIWQYCDVRISDEFWMNRPRTMNNKGLVDEFRRRKLAYRTVKELFQKV